MHAETTTLHQQVRNNREDTAKYSAIFDARFHFTERGSRRAFVGMKGNWLLDLDFLIELPLVFCHDLTCLALPCLCEIEGQCVVCPTVLSLTLLWSFFFFFAVTFPRYPRTAAQQSDPVRTQAISFRRNAGESDGKASRANERERERPKKFCVHSITNERTPSPVPKPPKKLVLKTNGKFSVPKKRPPKHQKQ